MAANLGPHKTEGIGMEFLPEFMDPAYFDAIHTISDEDAFNFVKELALERRYYLLAVHLVQLFMQPL